jgi:hypothetical protein
MALPVTPPYVFGNVTSSIPLTNLDADFATIYAAVNGIGNGTVSLANVSITGGTISNVSETATSYVATKVISTSSNIGAYSYGTLSYSDVNIFESFAASANTYVQNILQNTNAGTAASADYVVSNNLGTATTYYGDFGMNSSGWTGIAGTNSFGAPNMVYLTATTGDLLIGTTTANTLRFATNAGADSMQINGTTGIVSFPTTSAITLPNGTTGQQPTGVAGMLRFNSTTTQFEGYNGTSWASVSGGAAGSNTQVQFNSSGALAGSANMTFNGTALTLANDASISGLTVGKGGGAVNTNTVFGLGAGAANTTGSGEVFIGYQAGANNTTGSFNTAIGQQALQANTTASNNTAVGYQAAYTNQTAPRVNAFGYQAAYSANTLGYICAFGYQAAYATTSGYNITAIGNASLTANTTGVYNVAVGDQSLVTNTTGGYNVAIGYTALNSNTTASNNTAVGYQSGYSITTGTNNTCLGYSAGGYVTNLTTGSNNIYVGAYSQPSSASVGFELMIGNGTGKGTNTGYINMNGGGTYQGNNSTLWSITSDQRLKKNIVDNNVGLEKITQIKVRNFEYRLPEEVTELDQSSAINIKGIQLGAIAQELKEVLPDCVKTESTGVMSVDASNLTWYLVNAIKELKAEIDQLKGK